MRDNLYFDLKIIEFLTIYEVVQLNKSVLVQFMA